MQSTKLPSQKSFNTRFQLPNFQNFNFNETWPTVTGYHYQKPSHPISTPHLASVRSHRHLQGGFIRFIHSIWDSFNEPAETTESSNASNKTERHTTRKQLLLKIRTHEITAKYTVAVSRVWMKYWILPVVVSHEVDCCNGAVFESILL